MTNSHTPATQPLRPHPLHRRGRTPALAALILALCCALPAVAAQKQHHHKKKTKAKPVVSVPLETYANRASAMAFARQLEQEAGWEPGWAQGWLAQAQQIATVQRLVLPPPVGTAKNWSAYCQRFVEPRRITAGVRFWQDNAADLQRAETTYGVPAWLIAGIIGVETLYGQHTGQYRALDALATLAFDFPTEHPRAAQRAAYFQSELAALLRLAHDSGTAPTDWRGSYAGAMGLPQFMPSNWSKLGVDFDGDGRIDLLRSPADAIGSVARYMQSFGWQSGLPTHYSVQLNASDEQMTTLLAPDILPSFTLADMQALGAQPLGVPAQHSGLLALVRLDNGDPAAGGLPPSYVAGTQNFYVVTRYNWSSYYALAVITLGQTVQAAVLGQNSSAPACP